MQFVALRCVRRPRDGTGASEVVVFRKREIAVVWSSVVAQSSIPCRFFPLPGFKHLSKISLATFTHAAFRFLQNIFSRTTSHTPQRRYFRKRTTSQFTQSSSQIVEMADSSVAANGNSLLETTKTSEVRYRYPKSLPFHGTIWTDMLTTPYSILLLLSVEATLLVMTRPGTKQLTLFPDAAAAYQSVANGMEHHQKIHSIWLITDTGSQAPLPRMSTTTLRRLPTSCPTSLLPDALLRLPLPLVSL